MTRGSRVLVTMTGANQQMKNHLLRSAAFHREGVGDLVPHDVDCRRRPAAAGARSELARARRRQLQRPVHSGVQGAAGFQGEAVATISPEGPPSNTTAGCNRPERLPFGVKEESA